MTIAVSINKPGIKARAAASKRNLNLLATLLTNTTGSHAQATTDLATAQAALDALIITVAAL